VRRREVPFERVLELGRDESRHRLAYQVSGFVAEPVEQSLIHEHDRPTPVARDDATVHLVDDLLEEVLLRVESTVRRHRSDRI